jgi:hypothetical protein
MNKMLTHLLLRYGTLWFPSTDVSILSTLLTPEKGNPLFKPHAKKDFLA